MIPHSAQPEVTQYSAKVERADLTVSRVVREAWPGASWNQARDLCRSGRVRVDGQVVSEPEARVALGALVEFDP